MSNDRLEPAQVWEIVERDIAVLHEETAALLAE